jgi:hypothetical protein
LVTTVLLVATALPASAKTPPFEMTVEPQGDTIRVEVTIGNGDPLFLESFDSPELDGLLAVFPADQVDEEGRPLSVIDEGTEVPLRRVQAGTYQGSIALRPGHWAVVPFPGVTGAIRGTAEGWYPDAVLVELPEERNALWALAAVGAIITIVAGLRTAVGLRRA